jgi:hypothetical protein
MVIDGEVVMNEPPIPMLSAPSEAMTGSSVTFDGRESYDPDDGDRVEKYFFDLGDGHNSGWVEFAQFSYGNGYSEPGIYIASLRVKDSHGLESTASDTVTIHVTEMPSNVPPTAHLSVIPVTPDIGEEVIFDGGGSSDPDGTVTEYAFDFGDGKSTGWVSTSVVSHSYGIEGRFTVTLVVKDDGALESEPDSWSLSVVHINVAPTANIVSIEPMIVIEGEEVVFTGSGEDSDGIVEAYEWESDLDGVIGTTPILHVDTLRVGYHNISFKVRDDEDEWSMSVTGSVTVSPNQEFHIEDMTSKRESRTDSRIKFKVVYTDPENDMPTVFNLLYAKNDAWKEIMLEEADATDIDCTDGKEYTLIREFDVGKWKYSFEFDNEKNTMKATDVVEFEVLEESSIPIPFVGSFQVILAIIICMIAIGSKRHIQG